MTPSYIMALFLSLWLRLCCAKFFVVYNFLAAVCGAVGFQFLFQPASIDAAAAVFGIVDNGLQEGNPGVDAGDVKRSQSLPGSIGGFFAVGAVNDQFR